MIVTTSWDDGHPLDQRLAELLCKYAIAATFYIPRNSQRPTLGTSELKAIGDQFEIGAHTLDHLALTTLQDHQAAAQIRDSKAWVESVIGKPCQMFCPPLGKFNSAHVEMIRFSGYIGYRTVEMASTKSPNATSGLAEMATTIQSQPHTNAAYVRNAVRRLRLGAIARTLRLWNRSDWTNRAQWYLSETARNGGVFHLWGHSWEIDECDQWGPLEAVLGQLGEMIRSGIAVTQTNAQVCASVLSNY